MIRRATTEDIDHATALGRQMFNRSHWRDLNEYDPHRFNATLAALLARDDAAVFVSPGGLLVLIVVPLWFADINTVQELLFWTLDGSGDALRAAGEKWAAGQGASMPIVMGAHEPGDMEAMTRWYRRAGYEPHGRTYRKVLHGH